MLPSASFVAGSSTSTGSLDTFNALKAICVPLISNSRLSPEVIPRASRILSQLDSLLNNILAAETVLAPSIIEYVFFPISHILQLNPISAIPDVILEKLMGIMDALFEQWWWSCQIEVWEQVLMLSSAILSGIDASPDPKGKRKDRDEETKRATAQCLWTVLRRHSESHKVTTSLNHTASAAQERFSMFQSRGRAPKLLPIFGQTLTSLLDTSQSSNRRLQDVSLELIHALITDYLPEAFIPSILPGVASAMAKVALGGREGKGWSRGDTVDGALKVMEAIIVAAVGNEICEAEGALRSVTRLEDLVQVSESDGQPHPVASAPSLGASRFFTPRTSVWLAASASQLQMVINTLSSLLSHPNTIALLSLSQFSFALLSAASRTLPDSQLLLLSFLLSLSTNQSPEVAASSHAHLLSLLLPPSQARFTHLQILLQSTRDNLISLPRLLPSHSDAKVEHLARQVSAACQLSGSIHAVSGGLGMLLGPTGGIEKWGWSLLSMLEFRVPQHFVSTVQPRQALLEGSSPEGTTSYPFPEVDMKHVSSRTTREALNGMFRALGTATGTDCLFAIEWFVGVAKQGRTAREVGALWCAGRILEGVSGISTESTDSHRRTMSKGVEKTSRWIARSIAEFWDQDEDTAVHNVPSMHVSESDGRLPLEYVKGLTPLVTQFDLNKHGTTTESSLQSQRILHKVLSLQLLSITAGIVQSRFMRLLLPTLYPLLHSLVSQSAYVSSTALAALHYITSAIAYATPSNLLLANFDYALDGVARRLDRRQLDPEAAKVLVVLVRLVGKDIVSRAGDVVEACFDRLDEFHGYASLVEGLIEVLAEVVKVLEIDQETGNGTTERDHRSSEAPEGHVQSFLEWYQHRNDPLEEDTEDYGPAPRQYWGNLTGKGKEKEVDSNESEPNMPDVPNDPPSTPSQTLTQQIVSRSIYFLTHPSPLIRTRILGLLDSACPILSESVLLPSIHMAWPYVLNRFGDSEAYVVSAAASLIASLAENVGEFMTTRIWNDVWPRFRVILSKLEEADAHSGLARRGYSTLRTESAYSHSHRLHMSILRTMRAVAKGVQMRSDVLWDVLAAFRRFLHIGAHQELQHCAREVYITLLAENRDVVWLMLSATMGKDILGVADTKLQSMAFLREQKWDIGANARIILGKNDSTRADSDELQTE